MFPVHVDLYELDHRELLRLVVYLTKYFILKMAISLHIRYIGNSSRYRYNRGIL